MNGSLGFHLKSLCRAIWFLPTLYTLVAILALVVAGLIGPFLPKTIVEAFDFEVVDRIFGILASSMLALAVFSLTAMVAAIQAATQTATPRVRALLMEDRTAQTTISVFIGSFLFSLLSIIGLASGVYDSFGKLVLFALGLVVIAAIVVTLIWWIQKLSRIGGVTEAIDRVERITAEAFRSIAANPDFGGRIAAEPPKSAVAISGNAIGYVQHVDGARLGEIGERLERTVHIAARPGSYVDPTRPIAFMEGDVDVDDSLRAEIRRAFVIGGERTFRTDPRFGLIVLSEIASRALSPGVNDPGTAIDVIGALTRLLDGWGAETEAASGQEVTYPQLTVAAFDVDAIFMDAFRPIGRDGAAIFEVQNRLQRCLATLAATRPELFGGPAQEISREALQRSRAAMTCKPEISELEAAADRVGREKVAEKSAR